LLTNSIDDKGYHPQSLPSRRADKFTRITLNALPQTQADTSALYNGSE